MVATTDVPMTAGQNKDLPRHVDVLIIGAGFSGLCMSIKLKQAGLQSFLVVDKSSQMGGVWRDNTYPGAGCDVPSMLYSFSFALKPDWRRKFADQREIWEYMEECADRFHVRPHMHFNIEVRRAVFDEHQEFWRVTTSHGEVTARAIVSGVGQLNRPAYPQLPGMDEFQGKYFHSAEWAHEHHLTGCRVAVVGTGASAIQVVPAIASSTQKLVVFQRSPPWVMPKADRPYTDWDHWIFRHIPFAARAARLKTYWTYEKNHSRVKASTKANQALRAKGIDVIRAGIKDPNLRESLTPDYPPGCKRILQSNEWYATLARDNVDVVTAGIERFTATGIVTDDGVEHPVDVVIFCTGFKASEFLMPMDIFGTGGQRLHDGWKDAAEAFKGVTVAGFPNLFLMFGPNTNVYNSVLFMIECQANYILHFLKKVSRQNLIFEVKHSVMEEFNKNLQERAKQYSYLSNCTNWYVSASGKLINNWPGSTLSYYFKTRRIDTQNYIVTRRSNTGVALEVTQT